ncbi:AbrB/MazE/SpoVT family DNA-binding domain-containing protein [Candidatus Woesearchaeota archaeon]|nr:AbrB/MazE/SpoVT family DNA-binding domain-containing protein [Candidatus Woesearchaeota archaeon]
MRRKLVKHGEKTLMVSLPAKWVKAQGLKKGDEIVITPKDSVLALSKGELSDSIEKIDINIQPESRRNARALLGNAYKLGYDEITIKFEGPAQLKLIKEQLQHMIGFEIVSLAKNTCLLKSVIKSSVEEYESIKKRAWHNIKSAFEVLCSDMDAGNFPNMDLVLELNENVLKITDFCRRLINKHSFLDVRTSCLEYSVHLKLVYLLPIIRDIYQYLQKNRIKPSKQLVDFSREISEQFEKLYVAYHKKDPDASVTIINKRELIDKKGFALLKNSEFAFTASKLLELNKIFFGCSAHIIGLHYLKEFKKEKQL